MRAHGERVERSFARCLDQGGMRRSFLQGLKNIEKRCIIHFAGLNLGYCCAHYPVLAHPRV